MPIDALTALVFSLWFPFVRIMSFVHFCPILDNKALNVRIRIIISLALAIIMAPLVPNVAEVSLLSMRGILLTFEQIIWGLVFGMTLQLVFLALQTAGQILSFNMGMSMAVMNDPNSGASTTVISQTVYIFAGLLFFVMDGHLLLVTILFKGFTYWPIGNALHPQSFKVMALALGWVFSSAMLLALPTTFIMLTVQGVFGLLNRIAPTLNLFSLGFPINMLFGLGCLAALFYNLPDHYLHFTNQILAMLDSMRVSNGG